MYLISLKEVLSVLGFINLCKTIHIPGLFVKTVTLDQYSLQSVIISVSLPFPSNTNTNSGL